MCKRIPDLSVAIILGSRGELPRIGLEIPAQIGGITSRKKRANPIAEFSHCSNFGDIALDRVVALVPTEGCALYGIQFAPDICLERPYSSHGRQRRAVCTLAPASRRGASL